MVSKWLMNAASAHIPLIHASSATPRGIWKLAATFGIDVFLCVLHLHCSSPFGSRSTVHLLIMHLLFARGDNATALISTDLGILAQSLLAAMSYNLGWQ
jgi:hypothetical protein